MCLGIAAEFYCFLVASSADWTEMFGGRSPGPLANHEEPVSSDKERGNIGTAQSAQQVVCDRACVVCGKVITGRRLVPLLCSQCDSVTHRDCTGLSKPEISRLKGVFSCRNCVPAAKAAPPPNTSRIDGTSNASDVVIASAEPAHKGRKSSFRWTY